jgi:hypothetical protein
MGSHVNEKSWLIALLVVWCLANNQMLEGKGQGSRENMLVLIKT